MPQSHVSRRKSALALPFMFGALAIFGASPSAAKIYSNNYAVVVANDTGANAYNGTWNIQLSYDSDKGTVTLTVLTPSAIYLKKYNNWTWTFTAKSVGANKITFNGLSPIPTKPEDQRGANPGKGDEMKIEGATLDTATGQLDIGKIINQNITFPIKSSAKLPQEDPKKGAKAATSTVPPGKSVHFDALTQTLSITGSSIVGLPTPGDPLLGAKVSYPNFLLTGYNPASGVYIFVNQDPSVDFTIANGTTTFETSTLSSLDYNVSTNTFYGVLTNSSFDAAGSPFISDISSALDFNGPAYEPLALNDVEITPDINLLDLTHGFETTGDSGATDLHYVEDPVPEPSSLWLIAIGIIGVAALRQKRAAMTPYSRSKTSTSGVT